MTTFPTITYKTGSVLEADELAIAHGCNTQGLMGAGVALLVKSAYPAVYENYRIACAAGRFNLGSAQAVWHLPNDDSEERLVYNLGTQVRTGADATRWGVFLSFANMAEDAKRKGISAVAIPRIAAGIGGLSWDLDVEPAIAEAITRSSHPNLAVVVYDLAVN